MEINCYFTFPTVYFALRAEAVLKKEDCVFHFKMVPVPRAISSSCGIALRCPCEEAHAIKEILAKHAVQWEDMHRLEEKARPEKKGDQ